MVLNPYFYDAATNRLTKYLYLYPFLTPLFRFRLHFEKESKEEVEKRKKSARERVLQPVSDKELEVEINNIYPSEKGPDVF